ncbi:hypothetical protein [Mycobacterium sp. 48b]|uniref:hypothetical protein n=1 Tax=Mycobacterium sp. 48b TaxID=3400426 RepID=UPI003AAB6DCF
MTGPDDGEEQLSALKRKLFGDSTANVPRVLIELLGHFGVGGFPAAVFERDYQNAAFGVYWLHGALLHKCEYSGREENAKATHRVFPLDRLTGFTSDFTFEWDDFHNRHTGWNRQITLTPELNEPIVLEVRGNTQWAAAQNELIDALLEAFGAM